MENYFANALSADQLRSISSIGLAHMGVHSVPAHASRAQYSEATALEALLGWLWLQGRTERINELFCGMMEE